MQACRPQRGPRERRAVARPPGSCGAPWRSWTARLAPGRARDQCPGVSAQARLTAPLCGWHADAPCCICFGQTICLCKCVMKWCACLLQDLHPAEPSCQQRRRERAKRLGGLRAWRHRAALARLQRRARLRGLRAVAVARVHGRWVRAQRARPAAALGYSGRAAGCCAISTLHSSSWTAACASHGRARGLPSTGAAVLGHCSPGLGSACRSRC